MNTIQTTGTDLEIHWTLQVKRKALSNIKEDVIYCVTPKAQESNTEV